MARLSAKPAPGRWIDYAKVTLGEMDEARAQEKEDFDALWVEHIRALKSGYLVGVILRFQRADGYAMYRVAKERPLVLEWVPQGDQWQVEPALLRGLNLTDVRKMAGQEAALLEMFGRSVE